MNAVTARAGDVAATAGYAASPPSNPGIVPPAFHPPSRAKTFASMPETDGEGVDRRETTTASPSGVTVIRACPPATRLELSQPASPMWRVAIVVLPQQGLHKAKTPSRRPASTTGRIESDPLSIATAL